MDQNKQVRTILFYDNSLFADGLKGQLRLRSNVIDVRKGPKYMEVDVLGDYSNVIEALGNPLFKSSSFDDFSSFWDGRFWEAHEAIENLWREEKDSYLRTYYQALILICASMIKFYKGDINVSDALMKKAISMLSSVPKYKKEEGFKELISHQKMIDTNNLK